MSDSDSLDSSSSSIHDMEDIEDPFEDINRYFWDNGYHLIYENARQHCNRMFAQALTKCLEKMD